MSPELNESNRNEASPSTASLSNQDPSAILLALSTSLSPDTFIQILQKHLYPTLDAFPLAQKTTVSHALFSAQRDADEVPEKLAEIDYAGRKRSLEGAVKAL